MKKEFISIIFVFAFFFCALKILPKTGCRVFKVDTPNRIYIDINKNHLFDEKTPFEVDSISYIENDKDYSKHPILNVLTDDEKFFLSYMAKEYSNKILNKKYVNISGNSLFINNNGLQSYESIMLSTKYTYNDDEQTQKELVNNIKNINLSEYVIYNPRSKKYHKLNCEEGRKLNNFKLKKLSELNDATPCKLCHFEKNKFYNQNKNKKQKFQKEKKKNTEQKYQNISIDFPSKINEKFIKDSINIFFIDLNKIDKPSNKCNSTACSALKQEINNANETIDFAIYGINNQPEIVNALINAQNRGVRLRWIYDINKSSQNYYEDNEKLAKMITTYKTDEEYENHNQSAIMHNKFFIFDNKRVWTGSANITSTDLSGFNSNYAVLIDSSEVAKIYSAEFEQMFNGKFHKYKNDFKVNEIKINDETVVKPVFSPQHNTMQTEIIPLIEKANNYIYIPMFFITHKGFANALINAHKRGVEVKVIHDATNAHANNTTHKILRSEGIKVKTENYAGKMHAKVLIIDDKISLIGSMNYTNSGNNKNDENIVIIKDAEVAKYLKQTFLYLWNKIPEKYETFDPRAESFESVGSCYDGIDNNFDNKIDSADDGCKVK
ncbi:phosphatidylserine/phosphatidylglycerophosphate/cardiolipin synthase family protein [bacterium]|nr:phosphatidylserine/phosphatidylglycerophosphate/cardiolipin synthase family protein [bacterium]